MKGIKELALQGLDPQGPPAGLHRREGNQGTSEGDPGSTRSTGGKARIRRSQDLKGLYPLPGRHPAPASLQSPEVHVQSVQDLGLELERRDERAADRIC